MINYAQTKTKPDGNSADPSEWEPLEQHLQEVAERTAQFAEAFRAGSGGRPAGLRHDLRK